LTIEPEKRMPVSARKAAGIIRNVLPKRIIQRPQPPIILGSREELINRRIQIRKWEATKSQLLKTPEGRKYLAHHFPRSYQTALLAERSPNAIKQTPVRVVKSLGKLFPRPHSRIMSRAIPQLPQLPPFPIGKKKVFLPNIVITLKRNVKMEPNYAVFEVPLNLSKLDLRDYLWHIYGVKTISIRSSVLPGILRRKYKMENVNRRIGPVVRTKARKKMIVQLAKPFRYPAELNKEELEACVTLYFLLIVGFKRSDMIELRNGDTEHSREESMVSHSILIQCTMYTTSGIRNTICYSLYTVFWRRTNISYGIGVHAYLRILRFGASLMLAISFITRWIIPLYLLTPAFLYYIKLFFHIFSKLEQIYLILGRYHLELTETQDSRLKILA
jgi:ribosomal protein L23